MKKVEHVQRHQTVHAILLDEPDGQTIRIFAQEVDALECVCAHMRKHFVVPVRSFEAVWLTQGDFEEGLQNLGLKDFVDRFLSLHVNLSWMMELDVEEEYEELFGEGASQ